MSIEQSGMIFAAVVLTLITIITVVVLWRGMEVARTKIAADKDQAYLKLAEEATEFQRQVAEDQKRTRSAVEDIQQRIASIEKLLKDVG